MEQNTGVFVAMDTHKETIAVAVAEAGRSGDVNRFSLCRVGMASVED